MVIKRKITESFDDDSNSNDDTTTTTTSSTNKIIKTDNDSKSEINKSKQEIINILKNDNIKTMNTKQVREWFSEIAYQVLNNMVLFIDGKSHLLVEIEFYFNGYNHIDTFAHGDSMQLENGTWYFHRTNGKGYRGGSFKGLDITFGCGEVDNVYGGILIRSIQNCSDKSVIDGPSLTVDHILKSTKQNDIVSFVKNNGRSIFQGENNQLYFKMRSECTLDELKCLPAVVGKSNILSCGRVGLTMKRYKTGQEYFFGGDYRYLRLPDKVKKGKNYMIVKLFFTGNDCSSIKNQVGSTLASIEKIKKQIKIGESLSSKDLDKFKGELQPDDIAQLLSLCNKLLIEKESKSNNGDKEEEVVEKVDDAATNDDEEQQEEEEADE